MGQKRNGTSIQNGEFPIVTVLICMGLFTLVASAGLFWWITSRAVETAEPELVQGSPDSVVVNNAEPPPVAASVSKSDDNIDAEQGVASVDDRVEVPPVVEAPPDQAAADTPEMPAPNHPESGAIAPGEMAEWKKMLGLSATIEGVVLKEGESSTGKTRYLWFAADRDNNAMVYMLTREIGEDLSLEYLRSLSGKRIRVTGIVEEQFGTKRIGVTIKNQTQIEIVE